MRLLKFIGAFLVTFILIFLFAFGFNMDVIYTLWNNQDGIQEGREWVSKTNSLKGLNEYIEAQPQHVSMASTAISDPDSSIVYNEHTPRTMGRLSVLFTLIEYARGVDAGDIDPNEQIPLDTVNRYVLPYMDASDHQNTLATLRKEGKITDNQTVTLNDLVQVSIKFNDIAVADYLLFKIGLQNLEQLFDDLALQETELPLPFSGLYIALRPAKGDTTAAAHFDSLSQLPMDEFRETVIANATQLHSNEAFRSDIVNQFKETEGLGIKFTEQRDALAFFPKTTAYEMSQLMKKIQRDQLFSPAISETVKSFLDWPLEDKDSRFNKDFAHYGAIYDNRLGMVNGIDYGQSSYGEEPFAQAVFFDELPIAFWFHMSSNLMHQDFMQRLTWDRALREATAKATENPHSSN